VGIQFGVGSSGPTPGVPIDIVELSELDIGSLLHVIDDLGRENILEIRKGTLGPYAIYNIDDYCYGTFLTLTHLHHDLCHSLGFVNLLEFEP